MSYIIHHAIICTSSSDKEINSAHKKAKTLFPKKFVSHIISSKMNGYNTFLIIPDGSNEGWDESEDMDKLRGKFIDWLDSKKSGHIDYVEVKYGGDMPELAEIVNHNFRREE